MFGVAVMVGRKAGAGGRIAAEVLKHSPPGKESGYADFLRTHGDGSADPQSD